MRQMGAITMQHSMSGQEIRDFLAFLRIQASFRLVDLLRDNLAWGRDAAVALIECEAHRRGVTLTSK
jgi:hypothetical protein